MASVLVEKVCPVVVRGPVDARQILVFRHPLAGIQLVKGTIEPGETVEVGALRELAEESGVVDALAVGALGTSLDITESQRWHFVEVSVAALPDHWEHWAADDGGHLFQFFWWQLADASGRDWHPVFVRALAHIISALEH